MFILSSDKELAHSFKLIQEALIRQHGVGTPYSRFNKKEGHFVLNKKMVDPALVVKLEEGVKIGEDLIRIRKGAGKELDDFWENHGNHYNGIMDKNKREQEKREKLERRAAHSAGKKGAIELGGKMFAEINKLKSELKMVMAKTPNGKEIPSDFVPVLKALLQHHPKGEIKSTGLKGFIVDKHPEHP